MTAADTTAADVLAILAIAAELGVTLWIDGGWAVDALLGRQTRRHADVDVVLPRPDAERFVAALADRGWVELPRPYSTAWNFVLGDGTGREVDVHIVDMDDDGNGWYGPRENGEVYRAGALSGTGTVGGRTVACISPEWLVRFHTGYPPRAHDRADVAALCAAFGIPVPGDYAG